MQLGVALVSMALKSTAMAAVPLDADKALRDAAFVTKANLCTKERIRLERLACFDALFSTQIKVTQFENRHLLKPIEWRRAKEAELTRKNETHFLVTQLDEKEVKAGLWLTLPAQLSRQDASLQKENTLPILSLSCLDNISRVELIFDKALALSKAKVTLVGAQKTLATSWQMDEQGLVLRIGRGLASIEVMQFLAKRERVLFRSNNAALNGLEFNTKGLDEQINLLRLACHW